MKNTLPRKPSKVIEIALADLIKVEKSKTKRISMSAWIGHDYIWYGAGERSLKTVCTFCQAGAVVQGTMNLFKKHNIANPNTLYSQNLISEQDLNALLGLDYLRNGDIKRFLMYMQVSPDYSLKLSALDNKWVSYDSAPGEYKKWLRLVIAMLKEHEL